MIRATILVIAAIISLIPQVAFADQLIDDFEDISGWSGLQLETQEVHSGQGAGRWENTVEQQTVRKSFSPALDLSEKDHFRAWIYSENANDARISLVLDSNNPAESGWDYYRYEIEID